MYWAKQGIFAPPLPRDKSFGELVEWLKRDLGPEAPAVLFDLIQKAAAPRTEQLYTALLAGLKDPAAEEQLALLTSSAEKSLNVRGLAQYGLGLLRTESGWKSSLGAWEKAPSAEKNIYYPGMALFGERAFPLLLREAETNKHQGDAWSALRWFQAPELRDRLWQVVETCKDDDMRGGAMQALTGNPDSTVVARFLDLMENPDRPSGVRVDVKNRLQNLFANEGYTLEGDPALRDRILARWESLSPEFRWALLCDPAVRQAKPDALNALPPPDQLRFAYMYALAFDPSRHPQLACFAESHLEDGGLIWLYSALQRQGSYSDPTITSLAQREAMQPLRDGEEGGGGVWAWKILALAPPEIRAGILSALPRAMEDLSERDRQNVVAGLASVGPEASAAALGLLGKETSPDVRLELISVALGSPGNEEKVRALAGGEVDQILNGFTDAGIRYAANHSWGKRDGLLHYAEVVQRILGSYGSTQDIPRIRTYFSALVVPGALRTGDNASESDQDLRGMLQEQILTAIDAIQARQ